MWLWGRPLTERFLAYRCPMIHELVTYVAITCTQTSGHHSAEARQHNMTAGVWKLTNELNLSFQIYSVVPLLSAGERLHNEVTF